MGERAVSTHVYSGGMCIFRHENMRVRDEIIVYVMISYIL